MANSTQQSSFSAGLRVGGKDASRNSLNKQILPYSDDYILVICGVVSCIMMYTASRSYAILFFFFFLLLLMITENTK